MTPAPDVLTFGEALVSFRSAVPLAQGVELVTRLAGAESNVAIGLTRLGHAVTWAGRVGVDPFGDLVLAQLRAEGVTTEHVVRDEARPTGLMFVERRTADLARVEYRRDRSAGSALCRDDLEAALASVPRVLHVTGITPALSETARDATLWAARTAREVGAVVCLDVNHRSRLWTRGAAREILRPLVTLAHVVVASDDELELVAAGDEAAAVHSLLDGGATHVAVKRGADGATLVTPDGRVDQAAFPVTSVDPLGAGDAFTAGLLSGLLDGLAPEACLRRAAVLGAFAVSSHGDWEGLPRRAELSLLDEHRPGSALR